MRIRGLAVASALLCVLTGCSSSGSPAVAPNVTRTSAATTSYTLAPRPTVSLAPGAPLPTKVPASPGLVTIPHGASVREVAPGKSRICVGFQNLRGASVPSGSSLACSGIDLVGFDWSQFPDAKSSDGLRYGSFDVVGRFDGKKLVVKSATVHRFTASPPRSNARIQTPCAPPVGGWRIVDPTAKLTDGAAAGRLSYVARKLPGYAGLWLDHLGKTDANKVRVVMNVAVTRDKAGAERKLRKVWGGALCVSSAKHSQASLQNIANTSSRLPGWHGSSVDDGRVVVEVTYDDGSLQAWVDQNYEKGLVVVSPWLKPVLG